MAVVVNPQSNWNGMGCGNEKTHCIEWAFVKNRLCAELNGLYFHLLFLSKSFKITTVKTTTSKIAITVPKLIVRSLCCPYSH
jgi:hypothetical protein